MFYIYPRSKFFFSKNGEKNYFKNDTIFVTFLLVWRNPFVLKIESNYNIFVTMFNC